MDEEPEEMRMPCCKLSPDEKEALRTHGYDVLRPIAEGTFGLVYLSEYSKASESDRQFPKDVPVKVALKVMEVTSQPRNFMMHFLPRELTIHSRLSHPHILHVHSVLKINTKVILATRFAERGNLLDHLMKYGAVSEKQARRWVRQVAIALDYIHDLHLAHRDVKLENILITSSNNVKLGDFGFSRVCIDSVGTKVCSKTHCGSLAYAAPELIMGLNYEPPTVDMWALGVVMYCLLNGSFPFSTEKPPELLPAQLRGDWRLRSTAAGRTSPEAVALISALLRPNWRARATPRDVLTSGWLALEPALLVLSPLEEAALLKKEQFHLRDKIKIEIPV